MLQADTKASKRQILYWIEKINQHLVSQQQAPLQVIGSKEVVIEEETRLYLRRFLIAAKWFDHYVFNREERVVYLLLWMLVSSQYLSLQHFISTLDVSKSTILNDLQALQRML